MRIVNTGHPRSNKYDAMHPSNDRTKNVDDTPHPTCGFMNNSVTTMWKLIITRCEHYMNDCIVLLVYKLTQASVIYTYRISIVIISIFKQAGQSCD